MNSREELMHAIDSPTVEALARIFDPAHQRGDKSYSEQIVEILAQRLNRPTQCAPMLADIAQIIDAGWKSGKSSTDVAAEILREFDATPVTSTDDCGGGK